jgi:hypothetical protein
VLRGKESDWYEGVDYPQEVETMDMNGMMDSCMNAMGSMMGGGLMLFLLLLLLLVWVVGLAAVGALGFWAVRRLSANR